MKLFFSILLFLLLGASNWIKAQAPNCQNAFLSSFCSGIAQYPANYDGTGSGNGPQAQVGPNYDCLGTQGNPNYFSLTIDRSGDINFTLDNTNSLDIDFILWGPFSDLTAAQLACDSMGNGGRWGDITDCSYSSDAQELVSIANATEGEVYILMVTNYANTATSIFSTSTTGTGSIACPCDIPYTVDTLSALGNQGYITDTTNGISQFVICPNTPLGFRISTHTHPSDTLTLYAPFVTIQNTFSNATILSNYPNASINHFDSLDVFAVVTPTEDEIGVNNFFLGLKNAIYTGGLTDSACFDRLDMQVIVPGVRLTDRTICSGEQFQIIVDSIPSTSLGSSSYSWRQISGLPITLSSTSAANPIVTIPTSNRTSSNDSIILVVDYNYGSLCPMSDTMVLRFNDFSLMATTQLDSICAGNSTRLDAILSNSLRTFDCNDYEVNAIPYAPITGTGTQVDSFIRGSFDDGVTAALPIGFSFDFFCNTYTQFVMSTNGFISFDINVDDGCCDAELIPDNTDNINNIIALAWEDFVVDTTGTLEYFTVGTAPNRILVINYTQISHHPRPNNTPITIQALLYETTNIIEIHTTSQPNSGDKHTQGIENANGTRGFAVPGRNKQTWTATNDAYRFSPRIIDPLYTWSPTTSLNTSTIKNPLASPSTTTAYALTVSANACSYTDTINVTVLNSYPKPIILCDSSDLNSISFSWSDIGLPAGTGFYEYSLDGGATWTSVGNVFTTTITGLQPSTSYPIFIRGNANDGGVCPISPLGTSVCATQSPTCANNPPINIAFTLTNPSCYGDTTGCASALVTGGSGNNNFGFHWSSSQVDSASICNLAAGTYTLTVTDTITTIVPPSTTILYQEDFDRAHNWTFNNSTGTNGIDHNVWIVDANEAGQAVGDCSAAGSSNRTLHITPVSQASTGATYNIGGTCPLVACPETHMRAESPSLSTIGFSNINLEFNYIAGGDSLLDNAIVWYNDGTSWQVLNNSIKSTTCTNGKGKWTHFSAALPTSCENQSAIQVGIEWVNNDDGVGTLPSVAIDSIVLSAQQGGHATVCIETQAFRLRDPSPILVQIDSTLNPTCNSSADGYVHASTNRSAISYLWSTGDTTEALTNLNNGVYMVTATDTNGCTGTAQAILNIPNPIITTSVVTNSSCIGQPDGNINVSVIGGLSPFTYSWSTGNTTEDLNAVPNGIYSLTVTDANGCFIVRQDTITPTIDLVITDTIIRGCAGDPITVNITTTGGSSNYRYDWGTSSASTTNSAQFNPSVGAAITAIVTVTDQLNGCSVSDTILIQATNQIIVTLDSIQADGCDPTTPQNIYISANQGTVPYTYLWSDGNTTPNLLGASAGNYSVTVTDNNGCTATAGPFTISPLNLIDVSIDTINLVTACNGQATGALRAKATTLETTFVWNTGSTDSIVRNLAAGIYTVVGTNTSGCKDSASVEIIAPTLPTLDASVQTTGVREISVPLATSVTLMAGSSGFDYVWTSNAEPVTGNANIANSNTATTTASPEPAGQYTYIVTAKATTKDTVCFVTDTVMVTVEPAFKGIPTAFTPNGDNINDLFRPTFLKDEEVISFRVFNRWGEVVYNGDENHGEGWDGTYQGIPQPTEVYIYTIIYKRASEPEQREIKGEITLIR